MRQWFSEHPERARAERFFLLTSPLWMLAVGWVMLSGAALHLGDPGFLAFSLLVSAPALLGPLFLVGFDRHKLAPFLKWNLWVAVLVFFGTYVGTHYFFDLMGMRYRFPVSWTFQAELVGHSQQTVPVFMYPLTQAYFVTYFTVLVVLDRVITRVLSLGTWTRLGLGLFLAFSLAFTETFFMAHESIAQLFAYEKRDKMLWAGSWGYAIYFIIGLPLARRLDEEPEMSYGRVLLEALGASMAIFFALEMWARVVGRL